MQQLDITKSVTTFLEKKKEQRIDSFPYCMHPKNL